MAKRNKSKITGDFATRLEDLIQEKKKEGITIEMISKDTGVPTGSISKYQNDGGVAGIDSLVPLAKYFNVSTDFLLGLTEHPTTNLEVKELIKIIGLDESSINNIKYLIDNPLIGKECLTEFFSTPNLFQLFFAYKNYRENINHDSSNVITEWDIHLFELTQSIIAVAKFKEGEENEKI